MRTTRSEMSADRLEAVREYYKNYRENHRDKINECARKSYEANKDKRRAQIRALCRTLKEHKEALADDPERLSTDFILKLVQGDDA
jgi:hypothetical protein